MTETSVILGFIKALPQWMSGSAIFSFLYGIVRSVSRAFKGSLAGRFFSKLCSIRLDRENSMFYSVLNGIKSFILKVFHAIYSAAKRGFVFKLISKLFGNSFIFKIENMLAIVVFVMFLCPHEIWNNAYALLFVIFLTFMYIVAVFRKRGFGTDIKRVPLTLLLFVIAVIVSVFVSNTKADSFRVMLFFITSFAFFFITLGTANTRERFDKLAFALFAAVFASGLIAFVQRIRGIEVDPSLTDALLNAGMPGRAFSTMANPNNYAQFLIIFLPFCIAYALTRKSNSFKTLCVLALAVPFAALLLTYSRSGWLGFVVAIVMFIALYDKKYIPVLILAVICLIPFLPSSITNRILTIGNMEDSSNNYRVCIWTGTLLMMRDFWFTGTGLGPVAFHRLYVLYASEYARPAPHTHMLFMEVFAEMGTLGFIVFFCLIVSLLYSSSKAVRFEKNKSLRLYMIAAASSVAGILIIGFAEYVWFYPRVMFAFFIALGLAAASKRIKE